MKPMTRTNRFTRSLAGLLLVSAMPSLAAEVTPGRAPGVHVDPVGAGPFRYETAEGVDINVRVVARGLNHPWSIAWLPDGSALVTEKNAVALRRIVNGVLQKEPVQGVPSGAKISRYTGLLDVALHPDFAREPYIYLSYNKTLPGGKEAIAIARGRWDGKALQGTQDIFVGQEGTTN